MFHEKKVHIKSNLCTFVFCVLLNVNLLQSYLYDSITNKTIDNHFYALYSFHQIINIFFSLFFFSQDSPLKK